LCLASGGFKNTLVLSVKNVLGGRKVGTHGGSPALLVGNRLKSELPGANNRLQTAGLFPRRGDPRADSLVFAALPTGHT
jgi:hypothetical protein